MISNSQILIVEDDPVAATTLAAYLGKEGYRVHTAADGESMRERFARDDIDLVLLDISLPDDDGFSLLREIRRRSEIGVIMVTSKADEVDRIVALEIGADDYVVKPFNARELLARVKNLLRRSLAARRAATDHRLLRFAGWTLNLAGRTLSSPGGEEVALTRYEFDLLAALAGRAGQVLDRGTLADRLGGGRHVSGDRTIDVLIGRLRRKIELRPGEPRIIVTVQGVGYVLVA